MRKDALTASVALALVFLPARARGDEASPDTTAAFVAGTLTLAAAFGAGALLLATNPDSHTADNAGWLTMAGGFTLAPMASHAVVGEWLRGLAFGAPPAAAMGGTLALFQFDPGTVVHGSLPEQRVLWGLFLGGLFSGGLGVVDAAFAARRFRSVAVAPLAGPGHVGVQVGGAL